MRAIFASLIAAMWIGVALPARAATATVPLGDRVPGDAIVYVGWAGSDALAPKYDASHLKNIMAASEMPKMFDEFVPQLIKRVAKEDPGSAEVLRQIVAIGAPLWKHPTAVYFGGIDWNGPQPMPRLAVLCDAGADAADLSERITKLLENAPKDGPMPLLKTYGTLVVFAFGTPASIDADFAHAPVVNVANSPKFIKCLAQVQHDPAYIEFIDAEAGVKMVNEVLAKMNDVHSTERWNHARDALGLSGLRQGIVTAGFAGSSWDTEAFVSSTTGKQGVLALLNETPLNTDLLKAVPQSADRMTAGKFDLDAFVGEIHDIVAELDAGTAEQIDEGIARFNQVSGLDLRKDVLANLGNEWVFYADRTIGGPGLMGSVLVNKLKDADAADKALTQLAERANAIIADQMHEPEVKIEFHQSVVNGVTLHYLAVPFVTPTWAVKDGNLYLGLYPQVVSAAVEQVAKKAPSILQRTEFTALMKTLGNHPACSMEFLNLPGTAPEGYTDVLAITRLYLGMGDVMGVRTPMMVVPPLGKITPELAPSGSVTWTDAAGFHMKDITPFPGADVIAGSSFGSGAFLAEDSLLISILLPSLNKARETANRAKCASNEHQIGLGILLYQNEHNQKYPPDLGTLVKEEQLTPAVFVCPSGNNEVPAEIAAGTPDEQAKWVNEHADYVYLGKGLKGNVDATRVIAYEQDGAHGNDGMNLLYGDGHVEWQMRAVAMQQIQAAQQGK
jgi:prepilin-type processing-associated H-X9-DG protein